MRYPKVLQVPLSDYRRFQDGPWESARAELGLPDGTIKGKANAFAEQAFTSQSVLVRVWHESFDPVDVPASAWGEQSGRYSEEWQKV